MKYIVILISIILLSSCNSNEDNSPLGETGRRLVELTLMAGTVDEYLIDSYIGNLTIDTTIKYDISILKNQFDSLINEIKNIPTKSDALKYRKNYQLGISKAALTRLKVINNEKVSFDEECNNIYQFSPDIYEYEYYDSIIVLLDNFLEGKGELLNRISSYRNNFKIDNSDVDKAFKKAIKKSSEETKKYIKLPQIESIEIEYVFGAPWSAYNWYKGDYKSIIQVNKRVDIYLERILDLAAHESYPGHHVYYSLREKDYYRDSNYVEFSIYTLFSPVSFLAEGTAVYGNDLVFPKQSKIDYIRNEITGKYKYSNSELENYFQFLDLLNKLESVQITIARDYIDNKINDKDALRLLEKYGLESEESAIRRLSFIKRYRSYIINYTAGKKLVERYINKKAGDNHTKKWEVYKEILSKPYLPPDLVKEL